jgi:hypothetical protein
MAYDHTPYWYWPLDRWKLLLTMVLALALLLVGAINQPRPVAITAPVLQQPGSGDIFAAGEPVQIEGVWVPFFRASHYPDFQMPGPIELGDPVLPDRNLDRGIFAGRVHLLLTSIELSASYLIGTATHHRPIQYIT